MKWSHMPLTNWNATMLGVAAAGGVLAITMAPPPTELVLYRDALTGCEYVGNPKGGITPRVNVDGRQLCTP